MIIKILLLIIVHNVRHIDDICRAIIYLLYKRESFPPSLFLRPKSTPSTGSEQREKVFRKSENLKLASAGNERPHCQQIVAIKYYYWRFLLYFLLYSALGKFNATFNYERKSPPRGNRRSAGVCVAQS